MLQTLEPLASSPEVLNLSGNELGGHIPTDIMVYHKLKKLILYNMGLEGKSCMSRSMCIVLLLIVS